MSFDEKAIRRDTGGRFAEKTGSAPEVALAEAPLRTPRGHTLFRNYNSNWGRYEGWSRDDLDRINSFVERHGMQVTGKRSGRATEDGAFYKKVRYHMTGGRTIEAGTSTGEVAAQRAVAWLVHSARKYRDFPESREHYADSEKLAREVFGDEYDDMVNPPKSGLLSRLHAGMTFDPAQHNRASDGRFTEKTGSAAEVSLGPTPPTRRELRAVTDVFVLPRGGVRKDERLTASDTARIRDYLDRHDIVFAENGKKKSDVDAEAAESGAYGTADQALADLVIAARNHEKDNRFNEEEYATARELFGNEYQAIVNPKRTFWEQVRGF